MRFVEKKLAPLKLNEFIKNGGIKYDTDFPRKDVQKALINEQLGLCAYCMGRISLDLVKDVGEPSVIIEHYLPRNGPNARADLEVDFKNLLGVCRGGKDNQKTTFKIGLHCDQSKGSFLLKVLDPLEKSVEGSITFLLNGLIVPRKECEELSDDIDLLNLNEKFLLDTRKQILKRLNDGYKKEWKRDKSKVKTYLESELNKWTVVNTQGFLPRYNLVAIEFIKKKLVSLSKK